MTNFRYIWYAVVLCFTGLIAGAVYQYDFMKEYILAPQLDYLDSLIAWNGGLCLSVFVISAIVSVPADIPMLGEPLNRIVDTLSIFYHILLTSLSSITIERIGLNFLYFIIQHALIIMLPLYIIIDFIYYRFILLYNFSGTAFCTTMFLIRTFISKVNIILIAILIILPIELFSFHYVTDVVINPIETDAKSSYDNITVDFKNKITSIGGDVAGTSEASADDNSIFSSIKKMSKAISSTKEIASTLIEQIPDIWNLVVGYITILIATTLLKAIVIPLLSIYILIKVIQALFEIDFAEKYKAYSEEKELIQRNNRKYY